MPGGESTTMSRLLTSSGLFDEIKARASDGMAVFGTCAGMILLAADVLDGRPDQRSFGLIDLTVRRNGYGRQLDSFETELAVDGLAAPFHGVFIRAPRVESIGPAVEVLATAGDDPVLVRQGRILAAAFHPELTADTRLHERFVALVHADHQER
jgi:5'-phosphate synthase pdxT subunit